jgi:hypothetical protein
MAGFWRRFFGGQEKQPEANQYSAPPNRAPEPKSAKDIETPFKLNDKARMEVLNQFRNGADPEQIPPPPLGKTFGPTS